MYEIRANSEHLMSMVFQASRQCTKTVEWRKPRKMLKKAELLNIALLLKKVSDRRRET